jgi:heme exporter protein A
VIYLKGKSPVLYKISAMLSVQNLSCRRSGRFVFRQVEFSAMAGACVLVAGPNGSGKSTLLRVLAGLILPVAGQVEWLDADIFADNAAHRARFHYVGHLDAVKPGLSVREMVDYWRILDGAAKYDAATALDGFALGHLLDRPVRTLSAGQKRRLSLTRILLGDAPLWLLDEPTTALDAAGQQLLKQRITEHRQKGGIVIAASHDPLHLPDQQIIEMEGA